MTNVLEVKGLTTRFFARAGALTAVDNLSFEVARGEVLGLVGESGSGKSVTGFSIMGLLEMPGRVTDGQVLLNGTEITRLAPQDLRRLRGREMAMIFQDPMMTLNPVLRIDTQMCEAITAHDRVSWKAARARARDALERVGIAAAEDRLSAYPHQFSGGMRQRVAIAIALLNAPSLIIADEPTTALDVTIQAQILAQMQELCAETGTALLWITHDLTVVAGLAQRVAVMYAGRIVEIGPVDDVLDRPAHPYTQGLLASLPSAGEPGVPLQAIPGTAPALSAIPSGCAFAPRCRDAQDMCRLDRPAAQMIGPARRVECHFPLVAAQR